MIWERLVYFVAFCWIDQNREDVRDDVAIIQAQRTDLVHASKARLVAARKVYPLGSELFREAP